MHRVPLPLFLVIMAILACGCTGDAQRAGTAMPPPDGGEQYLSFLDTFSVPLNQSCNPAARLDGGMIAENRKRAEETRAIVSSGRKALAEIRVPPDLESSRTSLETALDELNAMVGYMVSPVYAGRVYSEMTDEERTLADMFSVHAQNYGALQPAIYDGRVCRPVQERYRNISQMCRLLHAGTSAPVPSGKP